MEKLDILCREIRCSKFLTAMAGVKFRLHLNDWVNTIVLNTCNLDLVSFQCYFNFALEICSSGFKTSLHQAIWIIGASHI